jgi:uncharacterized protein
MSRASNQHGMDMVMTQVLSRTSCAVTSDWRQALPVLTAGGITLRELQLSDALSLLDMLSTEEVARFISPPPTTVEGFERFIAWTHGERQAGRYVCFAVVPTGLSRAVGIFQIRAMEPGFGTAEWGFAMGSPFWGTGIFINAARSIVEFTFETIGVHRLEARAAVENGRGNGALAKIGAVKEGVLRRSFLRHGKYIDQALWSIVRDEWRQAKAVWGSIIH